jgi:hypothetical protein
MPISAACACGKSVRVKDDLAGKRVKCPACGQAFVIPASKPVKQVSQPSRKQNVSPAEEQFWDEGLRLAPQKASACPACAASLPEEAVVCVQCGFDRRTGVKRQTAVSSPAPHSSTVDRAIGQAAFGTALGLGLAAAVCFIILLVGCYGIYASGPGRAINAAAGANLFDSPFGKGISWLMAVGGLAGASGLGWLATRCLQRASDSAQRELNDQMATVADPAERAQMRALLNDLTGD